MIFYPTFSFFPLSFYHVNILKSFKPILIDEIASWNIPGNVAKLRKSRIKIHEAIKLLIWFWGQAGYE
jgi:hypothetical protein